MLFQYMLKNLVHKGTLHLLTANGRRFSYGDGAPQTTIKLHKKSLEWTLCLQPDLKIPEAYMDGELTIEEGTLRDFLQILTVNYEALGRSRLWRSLGKLSRFKARLGQFNPLPRARRNVSFHYDLSSKLYDLFLDQDRQYSCAYFSRPGVSLDQAQMDKKRHIASKLLLNRPGLKVLDIGSGWGGLGIYLAREADADVTGVTLSVEQYRISRQRARAAGLSGSCDFRLLDYRQDTGVYDRIVSVGMFEHVGKKNHAEYFAKIRDLLAEDGVAMVHAIGHLDGPAPVSPFIRKHIFPGTDVPALSEVTRTVERSGLFMTDIEILRLHYAETLKLWNERFQRRRAEAVALYGQRFCRKWDVYLIGCEMAFRHQGLMVFQIQLSKKLETVPMVRDYMYEWEHADHAAQNVVAFKRG